MFFFRQERLERDYAGLERQWQLWQNYIQLIIAARSLRIKLERGSIDAGT